MFLDDSGPIVKTKAKKFVFSVISNINDKRRELLDYCKKISNHIRFIMENHLAINILGMRVDMVQINYVVKTMKEWIDNKSYGNYIVISNANDALICKKDNRVSEAVNNSSLSVPDGISLIILSRLFGYRLKKRVYGPDLMLKFLEYTKDKGYTHFFYGSTEETMNKLVINLKNKFPKIKITGVYAPPFRALTSEEDSRIVHMINNASPSVLWAGLGCPKQQLWMYAHKDKLKVPVMVGVGAAFDFLARTRLQAPRWIRDSGFEWLFRLITEPKRLWRRYLVNNSLFIYYVAGELGLKVINLIAGNTLSKNNHQK